MSRRREPIDRYPGPDAVWRFLQRNRGTLAVLVGCALIAVLGVVFAKFWHGGCGGTPDQRDLVAELTADPLVAAMPPGAGSEQNQTTYSCPRTVSARTAASSGSRSLAVTVTRQIVLQEPLDVIRLYRYLDESGSIGDWRLIGTSDTSLSYCRVLRSYRVISDLELNGDQLVTQLRVWTDGLPCAPAVPTPPSEALR